MVSAIILPRVSMSPSHGIDPPLNTSNSFLLSGSWPLSDCLFVGDKLLKGKLNPVLLKEFPLEFASKDFVTIRNDIIRHSMKLE